MQVCQCLVYGEFHAGKHSHMRCVLQASSSPPTPAAALRPSKGGNPSRHASAALSGDAARAFSIGRAVSAKPFSIQHSAELSKGNHTEDHALPWLEVKQSSASQHVEAQDPRQLEASLGGQSSRADQLQLQLPVIEPLRNPFSDQASSPAPQWTFRPDARQNLSLLDM